MQEIMLGVAFASARGFTVMVQFLISISRNESDKIWALRTHPKYRCSAAFLSSSVALTIFFFLQVTILKQDLMVGIMLNGGGTVEPSSK
jgi:Trk-type K+ transport system membrane component